MATRWPRRTPPVQIARLQGAGPITKEPQFTDLITLLTLETPWSIWSLNLGELDFLSAQLTRLKDAIVSPNCSATHMTWSQTNCSRPLTRDPPTGSHTRSRRR